jgi:LmbE family N-acetylglucosaminyl deacetylase
MSDKPVLLAVLAHPDDESFGMGGTLALYARRNVEVHLVCATRGEAGDVAPDCLEGFESIAARRVYELRCAADILGLSGVHFLDYRDSGMSGSADNQHPNALCAAPVEQVAEEIAEYMRELKPQVVLTSDPIGGYMHPDHIAIHKATLRAFELSGDEGLMSDLPPFQPQKLYYYVFPKGLLRLALRLLTLFGRDPRKFGRNNDIDLQAIVEQGDFPSHAAIDTRPVRVARDQAAACHASQLYGGTPRRGPFSWLMSWFNRREYYMRALPEPEPGLRERDLFEGLFP